MPTGKTATGLPTPREECKDADDATGSGYPQQLHLILGSIEKKVTPSETNHRNYAPEIRWEIHIADGEIIHRR